MKKVLLIVFGGMTFSLYSQSPAPIEVTVLNFDEQVYVGDKVYFVGQNKKDTYFGVTNSEGKFTIELPQGDVYDIKIKSIGEEVEYNTIEVPTISSEAKFELMEMTIMYDSPKSYALNSLQFETGKAALKQESHVLLEDLIEIMELKPTMKIEIAGHTDSDGDAASNMILSQQRAIAVKNYLISKGLKAERISAKGYGETQAMADNASPEGKAKNRRTEIRVL